MNGSGKAEIPSLLTVPVLAHPGRCLATALQVQLSKKVVNMRLCSCHPYVEVTSDILVTLSHNDHLRDLRFAPRQRWPRSTYDRSLAPGCRNLIIPETARLNSSGTRGGTAQKMEENMAANPDQSFPECGDIPDILKVPEGNVLVVRAYGKGVQKYACPVSPTSKAVPHAILLAGDGDEGDVVAIHFGGPTWQALDGSSVVGDAANATHFTAPDPDGVDWLLLPAKSTTGNGLFRGVTYIQRLFTDGGKPPAEGCDKALNQTEVLVEYSAQYFFYGPAAP